jgi:hypothetical protein
MLSNAADCSLPCYHAVPILNDHGSNDIYVSICLPIHQYGISYSESEDFVWSCARVE